MTSPSEEINEESCPASDAAKYADLAVRYCENKLGGVEGNQAIFAALIISQAIRQFAIDIENSMQEMTESLDGVSSNVDQGFFSLSTCSIEDSLSELVKAVDDVAARL